MQRNRCSGPREASAAHGLVDGRLRSQRFRGELHLPSRRDGEHERPREGFPDEARRLVRQQPTHVDRGDRDATGNAHLPRGRGGLARRRDRRSRGRRLGRGGGGGRGGLGGSRIGIRGERERGRKAHESAGCEKTDPYRAYAQFHVVSVDTNVDGSFVTTASTPATTTREKSRGSSTVHATTDAPRACARRTARGLTSSCLSTRTVACARESNGPTSSGVSGRSERRPRLTTGPKRRFLLMPSRSSGNDAPTRMRGSSRARRRNASWWKELTRLRSRQPEVPKSSYDTLERARGLQIDVHADLGRLVGEERERLVEGQKVGRESPKLRERHRPDSAFAPRRGSPRGDRPSVRSPAPRRARRARRTR